MNSETITLPFDEELLPITTLSVGKVNCMYEHGRIRYLKYDGREIIRMIYFAVRDKDWNTASYTVEAESIQSTSDGFLVSYTSFHKLDGIDYRADVVIKADVNKLTFTVKGEALSSFKKNRIGICVLHPIKECKGIEVNVTRPDGTEYNSRFPYLIAPHQPFTSIKKMRYTIQDGISAHIEFEGEIFETEDQRNWADSSFKTYSTPLAAPFPVDVAQGERIDQRLELRLNGRTSKEPEEAKMRETRIPVPKIGYACTEQQLHDDEIEMLRQIPLDHYRVELHLASSHWKEQLRIKFEEASKLQTLLELIVFYSNDHENESSSFLSALKDYGYGINSVLALHTGQPVTPGKLMDIHYSEIKSQHRHIQLGFGTDRFFADLNRNRPVHGHYDFVSFSLNPQVHASDSRSLLENLQHQADLVESAQAFAPGKQIHVSPITLTIRSSSKFLNGLPRDYDPRLHRTFGALWTLHTLNNLAKADRLTFYQVKGYRGIIEDKKQTPSPVFILLKAIRHFNPKWIVHDSSGEAFLQPRIVMENEVGKRLEFLTPISEHFRYFGTG